MAIWQQVWRAGNRISSGFGLWSHSVMFTEDAPTVVRVWTETLTTLGYSPVDVVLYGDWRDGRHIADGMWDILGENDGLKDTSVIALMLRDYIFNQAKSAEEVRKVNAEQVSPESVDNRKYLSNVLGHFGPNSPYKATS